MSIRSRVQAFEAAAAASSAYQKPSQVSPRTSLTFSSDDALTAASSSAPASPVNHAGLDDFDSFIVMAPPASTSPSPTRPPLPAKPARVAPPSAPLINFSSPAKPPPSISDSTQTIAPALPPRKKPSTPSLNATNSTGPNGSNPPPLPRRTSATTTSSGSSSNSRSTPTTGGDQSKSPNSLSAGASRHTHASSTSSFQSLSLSDKDEDASTALEEDSVTISSAATSLSSHQSTGSKSRAPAPTAVARKAPPPIPTRPLLRQSSGSSTSSGPGLKPAFVSTVPVQQNVPYQVRRAAPPPPSKTASPRPSAPSSPVPSVSSSIYRKPPPPPFTIASDATSRLSPMLTPSGRRKVPIPPAARQRYEAVFVINLVNKNKPKAVPDLLAPSPELVVPKRRSPGWRGTSIDFRTTPMKKTLTEEEMANMLPASLVKHIWTCSKLDRKTLRTIWSECDTDQTGWLDRESFILGMWRIDEELSRRAAAAKTSPAGYGSVSRNSSRSVRR